VREFQTQLLHYFSKSDNKSNHHLQRFFATAKIIENSPKFSKISSTVIAHCRWHSKLTFEKFLLSSAVFVCNSSAVASGLNQDKGCFSPANICRTLPIIWVFLWNRSDTKHFLCVPPRFESHLRWRNTVNCNILERCSNAIFFSEVQYFPAKSTAIFFSDVRTLKVGLGILEITSAKRCPQVWPWFGRSLFSTVTDFVEFDPAV